MEAMHTLARRLRTAASDPWTVYGHMRARAQQDWAADRLAALAKEAGIDGVRLILSFDCDTDEDIAVAWEVHSRLLDMGVCATYAVPGELLMRGADVYRRIAETGAPFLNHGHTDHTYYDAERGDYASCFFYDELPRDVVEADIVAGDATVQQVLGVAPKGFRTPHFGCFQKPDQLLFQHAILERLGYRYSSSTVPAYGLRYGPMFDRFGLPEFAVTGLASRPLTILDTWGTFRAHDRKFSPDDYRAEMLALGSALAERGAGVLNYYADPSHIHDSPIFFEAIKSLLSITRFTRYEDLLADG